MKTAFSWWVFWPSFIFVEYREELSGECAFTCIHTQHIQHTQTHTCTQTHTNIHIYTYILCVMSMCGLCVCVSKKSNWSINALAPINLFINQNKIKSPLNPLIIFLLHSCESVCAVLCNDCHNSSQCILVLEAVFSFLSFLYRRSVYRTYHFL